MWVMSREDSGSVRGVKDHVPCGSFLGRNWAVHPEREGGEGEQHVLTAPSSYLPRDH